MTAAQLIDKLAHLDQHLQVEIATSPRKDEWYEIAEVEVTENFRGNAILVIHTD